MPNLLSVTKDVAASDPISVSGQNPKGFLKQVTLCDRGDSGAAQRCFIPTFVKQPRKNWAYAGCRQV